VHRVKLHGDTPVCVLDVLQKDEYVRQLLGSQYDQDADPPLLYGRTNTTVWTRLILFCATPDADFVSIEGFILLVSMFYNSK